MEECKYYFTVKHCFKKEIKTDRRREIKIIVARLPNK